MSRYFLNKMIDHTFSFSSYTTFLIVAAVICCYAVVSLSYSFSTDDNPIRQVSDASQLHFQYSADAFSAVDHHQDHDDDNFDDFSFAPYYPRFFPSLYFIYFNLFCYYYYYNLILTLYSHRLFLFVHFTL